MVADRRVDAAGTGGLASRSATFDDAFVDRLAHAVQALEFERRVAGGDHGRSHGMRIVGGELAHELLRVGQHQAHAGEKRHIGVPLACEDRIVGEAAFLRPFDLAVPVRALDEADGDALAAFLGNAPEPAQDRHGAAAVGLDGDAQTIPGSDRRVDERFTEHAQRGFEAVLLLGIDRDAETARHGVMGQRVQARQQFLQEPLFMAGLETRMQGRQLYGNGWARNDGVGIERMKRPNRQADRIDGGDVTLKIALCVGIRPGGLAQHVVGNPVALLFVATRAGDGILDRPAKNELLAKQLHRLPDRLPDEGFAGAGNKALQGIHGIGGPAVLQLHKAAGQHQAPRGGIDEQAVGMAAVAVPVPMRDFFGDERIGGFAVGDTQERLGETHQDDALLARQAVFAHERIDTAMLGLVGAGFLDDAAGDLGGAAAFVFGIDGALDEPADEPVFIDQMMRGDLIDPRQAAERRLAGGSRARSAHLRCLAYRDHRPCPFHAARARAIRSGPQTSRSGLAVQDARAG